MYGLAEESKRVISNFSNSLPLTFNNFEKFRKMCQSFRCQSFRDNCTYIVSNECIKAQ